MNGFRILLRPSARRDLDRIPEIFFDGILARINRLPANPHPPGSKKLVGSENEWRLRAGDYRILYEIDDKSRLVLIFRIRNRREVYRY